jgi:uncharacterized repeat protein (TIGR01451 family)
MAFTNPLVALVADSNSDPVSGVVVIFAGPQAGASATFPNNGQATTDVNGMASITATANATVGGYTVNASFNSGAVSTSPGFSLTNTGAPDLAIVKTHAVTFSQGQNGATYSIAVTNVGNVASSGTVTVTDTLPTGLTLVSISGNGWTCGPPNAANVCTRSDALTAGMPYAAITVTVNVAANAPASVMNMATVSGGGDVNPNNNSSTDTTTINPITDVSSSVKVTQNGFGRNRATGVWTATMTVTKISASPINGPIQVVLTNLSSNATMVNNTGMRNGSPYLTVSQGTLAAGGAVSVSIQFTNPSGGFINYVPITDSGVF